MSDAAAKREERKRRILAKGGDRLSRITNTGRGKDYVGLDTEPVKPRAESAPLHSDALDVSAQLESGAGTPWGSERQGEQTTNPMAALMESMQQQGESAPSDPVAMFQQLMGSLRSGPDGAAAAAQSAPPAEVAYTKRLMRRLRLLQAAVVFAFAYYVVFASIFSHTHQTGLTGRPLEGESATAFARESYFRQWASLAWHYTPASAWLSAHDPSAFPVAALQQPLVALAPYISHRVLDMAHLPTWPVYYVFFTLEVALQGIRLALLQVRRCSNT